MAEREVIAPNGHTYIVDAPESATEEQMLSYIYNNVDSSVFRSPEPTSGGGTPGFFDSAIDTSRSLLSSSRTGLAAITGDAEEAAREGVQRQEDIASSTGELPSLSDIYTTFTDEGIGKGLAQLGGAIPGYAGQVAPTLATSLGGAAAGSAVAGPIGGVVGGLAANFPLWFGSNIERQYSEQTGKGKDPDIDVGKAAAYGAAQSAVEGVGAGVTLGSRLVGRLLGKSSTDLVGKAAKGPLTKSETATLRKSQDKLLKEAERSLASTAGRATARSAAGNLPVDIAQQVLERHQAGLDVLSPDAFEEYDQVAAASILGGGALGGAMSPMARSTARRQAQEAGLLETPGQKPIDPERLAKLKAEQGLSATEAYNQRMNEIREGRPLDVSDDVFNEIHGYATTPRQLNRPDQALQAEADQLRARLAALSDIARTKKGKDFLAPLTARLEAIDRELNEREDIRTLPEREARDRAIDARRARKNLPDHLNAKRSAERMFRAFYESKEIEQNKLTIKQIRDIPSKDRTDGQRLTLKTLEDVVRQQREEQRTRVQEQAKAENQRIQDEQTRVRENEKAQRAIPKGRRAEDSARTFALDNARTELAGLDNAQATQRYNTLSKKKTRTIDEQAQVEVLGDSLPIFTEEKLSNAGLNPRSNLYKALRNKNVGDDKQNAAARVALTKQLERSNLAPETRNSIYEMLDHPSFAESNLQDALPYRSIDDIPTNHQLDNRALDIIGVGKNAALRKSINRLTPEELDMSQPDSRDTMLDALEAYRDEQRGGGYVRPASIRENINEYIGRVSPDRISDVPAGDESAGTTTGTAPAGRSDGMGPRDDANVQSPNQALANAAAMFDETGMGDSFQNNGTPASGTTGDDAALINNDPKKVGGDAYMARAGSGDTPGAFTPAFVDAVNNNQIDHALNIILENDTGEFSGFDQLIAQRYLRGQGEMPAIEVVDRLVNSRGEEVSGQYDSNTDVIRLVHNEVDSHTLLHELTHAFVHRYITRNIDEGMTNTHVKGLNDVMEAAQDYFQDRGINTAEVYAFTNLSEFASEVMSNPDLQRAMMGIPYSSESSPGVRSMWGRFKEVLRDMLGLVLDNPVDNTLFAAMVHVEGLMNPGRAMQVTEQGIPVPNPVVDMVRTTTAKTGELTPEDYRNIARAPEQEHRSAFKQFASNFNKGLDNIDRATRFRTKTVDNLASVESKIAREFESGIRNALGEIDPTQLARQAVDHNRVALQVYRVGGLRFNPEVNQYEAYQLKDAEGNDVSPQKAIDMIRSLAGSMGDTYENAKSRVATILEGMRIYELREQNNLLESQARQLEADGTREGIRKAYDVRQDKVALHLLNEEIDAAKEVFDKSPEIQQIQQILNATRFNLIDAMVDSGRLTEKTAEIFKSFVNYVPLNRVRDVLETSDLTAMRGRAGIGVLRSIPELQGSFERPVANTIDNYIQTMGWMTSETLKNHSSRQLLSALERAGQAYLITDETPAKNKNLISPAVYVDGSPVRYQLESEFDLAAFAQASEHNSSAVNALAMTARILRATITAIPTFSLNMVVQDATSRVTTQSGTKSIPTAIKLLGKFPSIVYRNWRGIRSETGETLHNFGIVGNFDYNPIDPLASLERESGVSGQNIFQKGLYQLEQIAKASDQAAREAVYERTMLETGDQALALMRAREYINYSRRGASKSVRTLTKVVPFFNAYAQGLDIMFRGITGHRAASGLDKAAAKRYVLGRMATLAALGFAYSVAMQDDEDYKNAPEYLRQKGWILPRSLTQAFDGPDGRHTPLIIPYAREYSFLLKTIPETVVQMYNDSAQGEDKEVWDVTKELLGAGANAYVMQPIPPGIRQAIEWTTNHSFFTGRELVAEHQRQMPTAQQVNNETSLLAEQLGKNFGLSPIKLDNFIKGSFGTAGAMALRMYDAAFTNRPELPINKIPSLSPFFGPEVGTRIVNDFYDLKNRVDEAVNGANALRESPEAYAEFVQENARYIQLKRYVNNKNQQLMQINKIRRALMREDDLDMTPAERRQELKRLDQIRVDILQDVPKVRGMVVRQK